MEDFLKRTWIIFCLLIVFFQSVAIPLQSNEEVSLNALTAIQVVGERIQTVRGIDGLYTQNTDPKTGIVYVLPKTKKRFQIDIATEQGHTFTLRLNPVDRFVPRIVIDPSMNQGAFLGCEQAVLRLMKMMVTGHRLKRSRVSHRRGPIQRLSPSLTVQKVKTVVSKKLVGQVFHIKNITNHPVALPHRILYTHAVRAIALQYDRLGPYKMTTVYTVATREVPHV